MSIKKSAKRLTHWTIAVALLPFLWAVLHQTGLMIPNLMSEGFYAWGLYAGGMLLYFLTERLLSRPMWLYVFGHELTHAITGLLSGAKIHSFKAKATGGEVRLSKSNAFIALSPYIVPLYSLGLIMMYVVTRQWWNPPQLRPVFQVLLGVALAFHISLTFSAIHKHQTDLKVLGFFLSGVLILLGNLLILAALGITLFTKTPTITDCGSALLKDTTQAWKTSLEVGWRGTKTLYQWIKEKQWTQ